MILYLLHLSVDLLNIEQNLKIFEAIRFFHLISFENRVYI
jgi:hypothetical protein